MVFTHSRACRLSVTPEERSAVQPRPAIRPPDPAGQTVRWVRALWGAAWHAPGWRSTALVEFNATSIGEVVCDAETSTDLADTADGSRCRPTGQRANTDGAGSCGNQTETELAADRDHRGETDKLPAPALLTSRWDSGIHLLSAERRQPPTRRKSRARCSTN